MQQLRQLGSDHPEHDAVLDAAEVLYERAHGHFNCMNAVLYRMGQRELIMSAQRMVKQGLANAAQRAHAAVLQSATPSISSGSGGLVVPGSPSAGKKRPHNKGGHSTGDQLQVHLPHSLSAQQVPSEAYEQWTTLMNVRRLRSPSCASRAVISPLVSSLTSPVHPLSLAEVPLEVSLAAFSPQQHPAFSSALASVAGLPSDTVMALYLLYLRTLPHASLAPFLDNVADMLTPTLWPASVLAGLGPVLGASIRRHLARRVNELVDLHAQLFPALRHAAPDVFASSMWSSLVSPKRRKGGNNRSPSAGSWDVPVQNNGVHHAGAVADEDDDPHGGYPFSLRRFMWAHDIIDMFSIRLPQPLRAPPVRQAQQQHQPRESPQDIVSPSSKRRNAQSAKQQHSVRSDDAITGSAQIPTSSVMDDDMWCQHVLSHVAVDVTCDMLMYGAASPPPSSLNANGQEVCDNGALRTSSAAAVGSKRRRHGPGHTSSCSLDSAAAMDTGHVAAAESAEPMDLDTRSSAVVSEEEVIRWRAPPVRLRLQRLRRAQNAALTSMPGARAGNVVDRNETKCDDENGDLDSRSSDGDSDPDMSAAEPCNSLMVPLLPMVSASRSSSFLELSML